MYSYILVVGRDIGRVPYMNLAHAAFGRARVGLSAIATLERRCGLIVGSSQHKIELELRSLVVIVMQ